MNLALLKKDFKSHWKLLVVFLAIVTLYLTVIIGMFDPQDVNLIQRLAGMKVSRGMLAAFGMGDVDPSLTGFLSGYFYGFLMLALPLVYTVILANKLVAALVDKGSMASILSAPVTRGQVARTQLAYLLATLTLLIGWTLIFGIVYSRLRFSEALDTAAFVRVNIGVWLMHLSLGAISFFCSCLFNETRYSVTFGTGIPMAFLLVQLLYNANTKLGWLKYLTLYSLYDARRLARSQPVAAQWIALVAIALILYVAAVRIFEKKDLPL